MMSLLRGSAGSLSSTDRAEMMISSYERYHKGYVGIQPENGSNIEGTERQNEELKGKYDIDPRSFWNDPEHVALLDFDLVSFANFIMSISAGSANSEREFSRMGYLLGKRRTRYTAVNTNKRLTLSNMIPQKRKLEHIMALKNIKRQKLFHR